MFTYSLPCYYHNLDCSPMYNVVEEQVSQLLTVSIRMPQSSRSWEEMLIIKIIVNYLIFNYLI